MTEPAAAELGESEDGYSCFSEVAEVGELEEGLCQHEGEEEYEAR